MIVEAAETVLSREYGGLVYVLQSAGSMYLQHTMTTAAARVMAQHLLDAADEAEAFAAKEAA